MSESTLAFLKEREGTFNGFNSKAFVILGLETLKVLQFNKDGGKKFKSLKKLN